MTPNDALPGPPELLPCPFCGGAAAVVYWNQRWLAGCTLCSVQFIERGSNSWNPNPDEDAAAKARAIRSWNVRAYGQQCRAEVAAGMGWQPIETAPRDGTIVLGWFANPRWPPGPGMLQWTDFNGGGWMHYANGTPTHWQPLPAAPQAPGAMGGENG